MPGTQILTNTTEVEDREIRIVLWKKLLQNPGYIVVHLCRELCRNLVISSKYSFFFFEGPEYFLFLFCPLISD